MTSLTFNDQDIKPPPPRKRFTGEPLKLPKFTFLLEGSIQHRQELASAIVDLNNEVLLCDLEEPIRLATQALLFGGFTLDHDLSKEEERQKPTPFPDSQTATVTVEDCIDNLTTLVSDMFGPGALGKIALKDWIEQGNDEMFERALFRDTPTIYDIAPFSNKYGPTQCLAIICNLSPRNPLHTYTGFGVKNIWVPVPELEKQIELIRNELTGTVHL